MYRTGKVAAGLAFSPQRPIIRRATNCLTANLIDLVRKMDSPQIDRPTLNVGMYIIKFAFDPKDKNYDRYRDNRDWDTEVVALDVDVLDRRLRQ